MTKNSLTKRVFLDFSKLDIAVILIGLFVVAPFSHLLWSQYKDDGRRKCLSVGDLVSYQNEVASGDDERALACLSEQNIWEGKHVFFYDHTIHYHCDALPMISKLRLLACIEKKKGKKT